MKARKTGGFGGYSQESRPSILFVSGCEEGEVLPRRNSAFKFQAGTFSPALSGNKELP